MKLIVLKRPSFWLRTASVLTVLFAIGHSLGGLEHWSPVGESPVLQAMRTFEFDAGGVRRTYLDFYLGFGWLVTAFLVMQAYLAWALAGHAVAGGPPTRSLAIVMLVVNVIAVVLAANYIFLVPAFSFSLIAACTAIGVLLWPRGA